MAAKCSVAGCVKLSRRKDLCHTHYMRLHRNGHLDLVRRANGTGGMSRGYVYISTGERNKRKPQHVLVAEKALGKKLPKGAVVHHVDLDRSNNEPKNLVVCPNQAYHMLLHKRMSDQANGRLQK